MTYNCYCCKASVEIAGIEFRDRVTILTRVHPITGTEKKSYVFDRFCTNCGTLLYGVSRPYKEVVNQDG